MTKNLTVKQDVKNDPKVSISLRVPSELRKLLIEKAALENKKLSEYLSNIITNKLSSETTESTPKKVEHLPLVNVNVEEKENESFWDKRKQEIPFPNLKSSTPKNDSKPKYDEELIFLVEPHIQKDFQRYINHLRQEYGGTVSEVIVAALIAITEDEHRLFPKPFNHYLKGVLLNTYADNQPYTKPLKTINYRKIIKYLFSLFFFILLIRRIKNYKFK